MKNKLDIGCGDNKPSEEWIGIDIVDTNDAELQVDLRNGVLPFKDDSFNEIRAVNSLEHINQSQFNKIVDEINRVGKKGCKVKIVMPHYLSWHARTADHEIKGVSKV